MEKTVNLNVPGVMEMGKEDLKEVGGDGWRAFLVGVTLRVAEEIGDFYNDAGPFYSPLR